MSPFMAMAPWDAMGWFDLPTERSTDLTGGGNPVRLVQANPNRVALLIASSAGTDLSVSTRARMVYPEGIPFGQGTTVLLLTHRDVGPLVQVEWWGQINGAAVGTFKVTTVELVLRQWPRDGKEVMAPWMSSRPN